MAKNNFLEKAGASHDKEKQHARGKVNGAAVKRDVQTPTGDERTTMLISLTTSQKKELQMLAVEQGASAAALVRDALISAGYITAKE